MAEFGHYIAAVVPLQQSHAVDAFLHQQPKGAKITSRPLWKRGKIRVESDICYFLAGAQALTGEDMVELCWIGVPSDPDTFVARALEAGHPRGLDVHVDVPMQRVVKET